MFTPNGIRLIMYKLNKKNICSGIQPNNRTIEQLFFNLRFFYFALLTNLFIITFLKNIMNTFVLKESFVRMTAAGKTAVMPNLFRHLRKCFGILIRQPPDFSISYLKHWNNKTEVIP